MLQMNILAILAASASSFMLGGLWYSPALFGKTWNREAGRSGECKQGHPAKVFGVAFLFALLAAFVYAWLMPAANSAATAVGLAVGAGVVAASFAINYQFANRSTALLLIDGGYHTVKFLIYRVIIGLGR